MARLLMRLAAFLLAVLLVLYGFCFIAQDKSNTDLPSIDDYIVYLRDTADFASKKSIELAKHIKEQFEKGED